MDVILAVVALGLILAACGGLDKRRRARIKFVNADGIRKHAAPPAQGGLWWP